MTIIEEIRSLENWYMNIGNGYQDGSGLLDVNRKLVTLLASLSEQISDADKLSVECDCAYKWKTELQSTNDIKNGGSVAKANALASINAMQEYKDKKLAECAYRRLKMVYDSGCKVSEVIKQHVSYLKKEREL